MVTNQLYNMLFSSVDSLLGLYRFDAWLEKLGSMALVAHTLQHKLEGIVQYARCLSALLQA